MNHNGVDSHSHICAHYKIDEDRCNKWEYNPLTEELTLDMQNDRKDDTKRVERWVKKIDWNTIVAPLIIKPIINPLELPAVDTITDEQISWLKEWASVRSSVRASVWDSVWHSVGDSVWNSVWDSVRASVRASVWDSVRAYTSSFFDFEYKHDFSPAIKLWESGLLPSFDGDTWRLHSGEDAHVVYEWKPEEVKE